MRLEYRYTQTLLCFAQMFAGSLQWVYILLFSRTVVFVTLLAICYMELHFL